VNDSDEGSGHQAAQPRRKDARRNKEALLDAAASVFATSGVEASVRDIAAKAGVGLGTIYRHFPTRADLIIAVYRHQVDACAEAGPALLATSATPHAALGQWINQFVDFLVTKHGLAAVLQSDNTGFEALHAYFLDRLVPVCTELLEAAAEAGDPCAASGTCASARTAIPTTTHAGWSSSSSRDCATPRPILAGQSPRRSTVRVRDGTVQIRLTCDRRPRDRSRHITANHRRRPSGRRRIL
jgi:AcrR family transcriptional regulator